MTISSNINQRQRFIIHLRAENKPLEHRRALTPSVVGELITQAGFTVYVEDSPLSCFTAAEYREAGAVILPENAWKESPNDGRIIVGLKEMPEEDTFPLIHEHVQFAHCFKKQEGWERVLSRFIEGESTLYDLEFLEDEQGVRISSFGFYAGYVGACLGVKDWCFKKMNDESKDMPGVKAFFDECELNNDVVMDLESVSTVKNITEPPRVLIIGSNGRCGKGAKEALSNVGIPKSHITEWGRTETSDPKNFKQIPQFDIFINCIYLKDPIEPFVTMESLNYEQRKLTTIVDVSADTTNPHNPIPVYNIATVFDKPTVKVEVSKGPKLSVISIDHLPSLLPRDASDFFATHLFKHLTNLPNRKEDPVWKRAEDLFKHHCDQL